MNLYIFLLLKIYQNFFLNFKNHSFKYENLFFFFSYVYNIIMEIM
jgi:hypothetical protein